MVVGCENEKGDTSVRDGSAVFHSPTQVSGTEKKKNRGDINEEIANCNDT